jgi:putative transcriptional regulator
MSHHHSTPNHHPSEETLFAHAAGGLDEAFRVVVATHLAGCARCRASVLMAERVGGAVLEEMADAALSAGALNRAMARLDDPAPSPPPPAVAPPGMPAALAGYTIGRWRGVAPGLSMAGVLAPARGRAGLHLLRIAPGMRMADHGHAGLELTAVLRGAFEDDSGTYRAGDVAENAEDADHVPVAIGEETCVCLIAIAGKLRFRHWLVRLLQPYFGV